MRLLKRSHDGSISLTSHFGSDRIPRYAILSHTWGADEDEASFQDFQDGRWQMKSSGARKIQLCADEAERSGLKYFWIDTCCIDKTSSSELQEAINSMFQWYRKAEICYVYLVDVLKSDQPGDDRHHEKIMEDFKLSRWFTRGWTLQELLAPHQLKFFSADWKMIGTKQSLRHQIGLATVRERLIWGSSRKTKRDEDLAYSMFGIFGVSMPLLYGEGRTKSFRRLKVEIEKDSLYLPSSLVPSGRWGGIQGQATGDSSTCSDMQFQPAVVSAPRIQLDVNPVTPIGTLYTPQNPGVMRKASSEQSRHAASSRSTLDRSVIQQRTMTLASQRPSPEYKPIAHVAPERGSLPMGRDITVSCNHNASEISIAYEGRLQTFRPPQALLKANGDRQAAVIAVKAFLQDRMGANVFQDTDIILHWAVPLMTSDADKIDMRDAAINAGCSPMSRVVSQIAAISTPMISSGSHKRKFSPPISPPLTGDTEWLAGESKRVCRPASPGRIEQTNVLTLLCNDTGCEMAAYTITEATGSHKEVALSKAVAAGWTELGSRLDMWLVQQFGADFSRLDRNLTATNSPFMTAFEQGVVCLSESSSDWEPIRLPLNLGDTTHGAYERNEQLVVLTKVVLVSLIDPLIHRIAGCFERMILELEKQDVDLTEITLMGSFIDVPYVRSKVASRVRACTKGLAPIVHEKHASVTTGALIREIENIKPTSTKALRHYGCIYSMPFREGVDPPRKATFNKFYQMKMCNQRVEWLIRKGQDITPQTVAASKNLYTCDLNDPDLTCRLRFVSCVSDHPPDWSDSPDVGATTGVIATEFVREEVARRFTQQNGQYGLRAVVKLAMGSDLGVLMAEQIEEASGQAMGKTTIKFE